jgi:hypothetical protein
VLEEYASEEIPLVVQKLKALSFDFQLFTTK